MSASDKKTPTLYSVFGPGGLLAAQLRNYEFRRGQLEMAEAVASALAESKHLIVEAGTGIGKTLAYLVPAILSGKRVVIASATKNLQEQIFYKDLPLLEKILSRRFTACLIKGRSNYLCLKKLADFERQPMLESMGEVAQLREIATWAASSESGDRMELKNLPEDFPLWSRLDARSEDCIGQKCSDFERCFVTRMRQRALESDVIIANHHLVFADLAVKQSDFGAVLPDYQYVVFDEAHELEDTATQYFGFQVSNYRLEEWERDTRQTLNAYSLQNEDCWRALDVLRVRSSELFSVLWSGEGRWALAEAVESVECGEERVQSLQSALMSASAALENLSDKPEMIYALLRRARELQEQLQFIWRRQDKNFVYWLECRGGTRSRRTRAKGRARQSDAERNVSWRGAEESTRHGVFLQASPIHIAGILQEKLFGQKQSVVLTSATLSVSERFDYLRTRLGMPSPRELICPSPFRPTEQAILFVPDGLPEASAASYIAASVALIAEILKITRGRAFVLFTSLDQMRRSAAKLKKEISFPLLVQGDTTRTALLNQFRSTPHAVLCATASFWQGVDVVGDQLSCVIIDKLPFAVPDDPLVRARTAALESEGRNGFYEYQIPQAIILLKQGLGRLIRSSTDYGVLAILDQRLLKKNYGSVFLSSLPAYRLTSNLKDVDKFFKAHEVKHLPHAAPRNQ